MSEFISIGGKNPRQLRIGDRRGQLVVVAFGAPYRGQLPPVRYRCDCGTAGSLWPSAWFDRVTCGHGKRPENTRVNKPEYRVWLGMRGRCRRPSDAGYANYGGRGIDVCARWNDFNAFLADMGLRPSSAYSIDRIDNDGGYWCGHPSCRDCSSAARRPNCRWVLVDVQARNRRHTHFIEFDGRRLCIVEWARRVGVSATVLGARLRAGWTVADALTLPINSTPPYRLMRYRARRTSRLLTHGSETLSLVEWAERTGIKSDTIARRLQFGWSVAEALTTPVGRRRNS